MVRFYLYIFLSVSILVITATAAEVYIVSCENCDYSDEDFVIGLGDEGEMISPGLCPICKEMFEVLLQEDDTEGKKKYECPLCSGSLHLYRDIGGEPLTEPTEGEYQCPRCGAYGLVFGIEAGEEELGLDNPRDDDISGR